MEMVVKKVKIYHLNGKQKGSTKLPKVFLTPLRSDLIKRAVVTLQSHRYQSQGRNPMAGKRTTAESYGVGRGLARIPRVKGERNPRSGSGAFAPGTVGGRLAHPPQAKKQIKKKVNRKERVQALKSAIAATADKEIVLQRGHKFTKRKGFPLVVSDAIQKLKDTKETHKTFINLGLMDDLNRVKNSLKIRPGKGKLRGRAKKHAVGPLLIIEKDQGIIKAIGNLLGVEAVNVRNLNVEHIAPGTHPGRLTVWSEGAFKALDSIFSEE